MQGGWAARVLVTAVDEYMFGHFRRQPAMSRGFHALDPSSPPTDTESLETVRMNRDPRGSHCRAPTHLRPRATMICRHCLDIMVARGQRDRPAPLRRVPEGPEALLAAGERGPARAARPAAGPARVRPAGTLGRRRSGLPATDSGQDRPSGGRPGWASRTRINWDLEPDPWRVFGARSIPYPSKRLTDLQQDPPRKAGPAPFMPRARPATGRNPLFARPNPAHPGLKKGVLPAGPFGWRRQGTGRCDARRGGFALW